VANWTDGEVDSLQATVHHNLDPAGMASDEFKHLPLVEVEG